MPLRQINVLLSYFFYIQGKQELPPKTGLASEHVWENLNII